MTPGYDARMARAEHLKTSYPFAAEILSYYAHICATQRELSQELRNSLERRPPDGFGGLREQVDLQVLMPKAEKALRGLAPHSPAPLAAFFEEFLARSADNRAAAIEDYARHGGTHEASGDSREQLVAAIVVQPYAELLAGRMAPPPAVAAGNLCPRCSAHAVAGVLRSEGDGGKRFLLCSFCGAEWEFRRILCAHCGESREQSLPVYVAERFPHIRVEACDTCRRCLRTVDLTKDGRAVPVVDDLAAIPLALWAEEHGYQRIQENLLGT
jgi:formate dehydrogenase accessory protein FdhE